MQAKETTAEKKINQLLKNLFATVGNLQLYHFLSNQTISRIENYLQSVFTKGPYMTAF